jgi:repressor LexA
MHTTLTDLERDILDYMIQYLRTYTYQPSVREIGEAFGIRSTKTVTEYLAALADKGYVERDPSRSRGIRLLGVDLNPQAVSVPCFLAPPDPARGFLGDGIEATYTLDRRMGIPRGGYFLRVRDDAWYAHGVCAGDLLLVDPMEGRGPVPIGSLVLVRAGGGVTLQRVSDGGSAVAHPSVIGRVVAIHQRVDGAMLPTSPTAH